MLQIFVLGLIYVPGFRTMSNLYSGFMYKSESVFQVAVLGLKVFSGFL